MDLELFGVVEEQNTHPVQGIHVEMYKIMVAACNGGGDPQR